MRERAEDTIVIEEMETNPDRFFTNLRKLALIVLHNHYNFVRDRDLQEDLVQEAILKAWTLLSSGSFDSKKSSIRNYCYTGMRNQMQNYLYKSRKEISVEEVRLSPEECDEYEEGLLTRFTDLNTNEYLYIKEDLIYEICDEFYRLGNYHDLLIDKLRDMGLIPCEYTELDPPEEVHEEILEVCFIHYVWRSMNYE